MIAQGLCFFCFCMRFQVRSSLARSSLSLNSRTFLKSLILHAFALLLIGV